MVFIEHYSDRLFDHCERCFSTIKLTKQLLFFKYNLQFFTKTLQKSGLPVVKLTFVVN